MVEKLHGRISIEYQGSRTTISTERLKLYENAAAVDKRSQHGVLTMTLIRNHIIIG